MSLLTKSEFEAIHNKSPYYIARYVKFLLDNGKNYGIKKSQLTCYIKVIKLGRVEELRSGTFVRSIISGKIKKKM